MIEEKENQEIVTNEPGEEILEEFLKPRRYRSKFWLGVFLLVTFIILAFVYKSCVIDTTIEPKVLKASMEMFNISSQWVESEKVNSPDFKGIVLVPQISFRVRNIGKVELYYVYFLGVFRLSDSTKVIGEGFNMAFKKTLKPGQESEPIVLTSKFGYNASSKEAFYRNAKDWKTAVVQIFVRSGASNLFPLKSFYISRRIEGLEIDVKITNDQNPI
jgi:hypothetical protein